MAVEIEKNGMAFYNAMAARSENEKAKEMFERAIELDPEYAEAYVDIYK